jgi:hypothetical protein
MTLHVRSTELLELSGRCGVEDAETLQRALLASPGSVVQWNECDSLHAAVLQILLTAKPLVRGVPSSPFLRTHIAPLLRVSASAPPPSR